MKKLIIKNIGKGGTAIAKNRQGYAPKVVEYVENKVCPLDGGKLIKPPVGTNRPIKCENGKYDFATKVSSGCDYKEWPKPKIAQDVDEAFERGGE
jgi:hypothetical protein